MVFNERLLRLFSALRRGQTFRFHTLPVGQQN